MILIIELVCVFCLEWRFAHARDGSTVGDRFSEVDQREVCRTRQWSLERHVEGGRESTRRSETRQAQEDGSGQLRWVLPRVRTLSASLLSFWIVLVYCFGCLFWTGSQKQTTPSLSRTKKQTTRKWIPETRRGRSVGGISRLKKNMATTCLRKRRCQSN